MTHFQHSDKENLGHLCALAHLGGDAKHIIMNWTSLQPKVTLCRKDNIFELLAEQCKLVELDVMDIAAEVRATTAYTVSLAVQREVGPHGKCSIQQVMRGLTNAIAMRDALDNGRGKFNLFSRCQFLLDAFTPPRRSSCQGVDPQNEGASEVHPG
jgi:hypothetical protein